MIILLKKELGIRRQIRQTLIIHDQILIESDKVKYYDISCSHCSNYFYLSWVGCENCNSLLCSMHIMNCGCGDPKMVLFTRVQDEELSLMLSPLIKKLEKPLS